MYGWIWMEGGVWREEYRGIERDVQRDGDRSTESGGWREMDGGRIMERGV